MYNDTERVRLTPEQKSVARATAAQLILQWIQLARSAGSHAKIAGTFDAREVAQFFAGLRLAPFVRNYLRVGYTLDFQGELAPITAGDITDVFCDEQYRRAETGKLRGAREIAQLVAAGHVRPGVEVSILTSWRKSAARRMCESLSDEGRKALLVGEYQPARVFGNSAGAGIVAGTGSIFARLIAADSKRDESSETDVQRFWRWAFSEDKPFEDNKPAEATDKPKTGLAALLAKVGVGGSTTPAPSVERVTDEEPGDDDGDDDVVPAAIALAFAPGLASTPPVVLIEPAKLSIAAVAGGLPTPILPVVEVSAALDAKVLVASLMAKAGNPIAEALIEGVGGGTISVADAAERARRFKLIE